MPRAKPPTGAAAAAAAAAAAERAALEPSGKLILSTLVRFFFVLLSEICSNSFTPTQPLQSTTTTSLLYHHNCVCNHMTNLTARALHCSNTWLKFDARFTTQPRTALNTPRARTIHAQRLSTHSHSSLSRADYSCVRASCRCGARQTPE
jgi:hypothetical protein